MGIRNRVGDDFSKWNHDRCNERRYMGLKKKEWEIRLMETQRKHLCFS